MGKEIFIEDTIYNNQNFKLSELLTCLPILNNNEIKNLEENKNGAINFFDAIAVKKSARTSYYFSIVSQYSFYGYTPNTADKILITNLESPSSLSADRLGFSLGSGFSFRFNDHWQLNVGLNATNIVKNISYSAQGIVPDSLKIDSKTAFSVALDPVIATNITVERSSYYLIGFNPSVQYTAHIKKQNLFCNGRNEF